MSQNPQYLQIYNEIRKSIATGVLNAGDKLESEVEIAKRFEVSRPTVRQALLELEREGLIERFRGKGTFVTDVSPSASTKHYRNTVGIIVPRLADLFIGRIITGLQEVVEPQGYSLSIHITNDSVAREREIIDSLIDSKVSGIIIHPTSGPKYNPSVFKLIDQHIPFVMTGRHYKFARCNYVEMDNFQGAYDVVAYLNSQGHRKIGLVSKPPLTKSSIENRILGFLKAHSDLGITVDMRHIFLDLVDSRSVYWIEQQSHEDKMVTQGQLKAFIENAKDLTAVVALNDLIAADLMHIYEEMGRIPGKDISIVGFDNVNFSVKLKPPLSSVDTSTVEMGRQAAGVLLKQIANPAHPIEQIVIPSKLMIRESISECTKELP